MEPEPGSVYIVTGGGGALAGAVARTFHRAGARLALADVSADSVRARARELEALPLVADLTDPDAAVRMVGETVDRFGRVDGLIHTAGGFAMGPAHEAGIDLYGRMMDLNVKTLFCAVRAVLPALLRRGGGFVAGISSSAVWNGGTAGMALYAAAKGAVALYLRSVEAEVRKSGIGVAVVYPMSPIDTPRNRADTPDADPASWVDPEEIAAALLFAATRGRRGRLLELPVAAG